MANRCGSTKPGAARSAVTRLQSVVTRAGGIHCWRYCSAKGLPNESSVKPKTAQQTQVPHSDANKMIRSTAQRQRLVSASTASSGDSISLSELFVQWTVARGSSFLTATPPIAGVWVCADTGRDLGKCRCLQALLRIEAPAIVKRQLKDGFKEFASEYLPVST